MAQYPQGIFQSLDWLLKKVKILALSKEPTYSISTTSAAYTLPGRGVYEITGVGNTLTFPDPALMNGMSITIINTSAGTQTVSATNSPYSLGTSNTLISSMLTTTCYRFVSINGKWRGGKLS